MEIETVNSNSGIYAQLQRATVHFNQALFDGILPDVLLTLQRGAGIAGYFSPKRWIHVSGKTASEIAMNPNFFGNNCLLTLFQTIVHEQCHLWQHEFGSPSRLGYHNAEWASKMVSVGLIPSSTGAPGGKQTGQKMSDYPTIDGPFIASCIDLLNDKFTIPWIDQGFDAKTTMRSLATPDLSLPPDVQKRLYAPIGDSIGLGYPKVDLQSAAKKRKLKYSCQRCHSNVWGKPGMRLRCVACDADFICQ